MSKLTDEQVAAVLADRRVSNDIFALAREAQEWRTLIKGGPCAVCKGTGLVDLGTDGMVIPRLWARTQPAGAVHVLVYNAPCPAGCIDGRTPGIIDRLKALALDYEHSTWQRTELAAIIALCEAVES